MRLAAVTTAGEHIVPRLLASFRRRFPETGAVLEVGNRRRVWDLLAHRQVDLAIGGRPPAGAPFRTLATRPNLLVVVAPAEEGARSAVRRVSLGELASATWLLREPGSGTRGTTEELLRELELDPSVLTVGSNFHPRERPGRSGASPCCPATRPPPPSIAERSRNGATARCRCVANGTW